MARFISSLFILVYSSYIPMNVLSLSFPSGIFIFLFFIFLHVMSLYLHSWGKVETSIYMHWCQSNINYRYWDSGGNKHRLLPPLHLTSRKWPLQLSPLTDSAKNRYWLNKYYLPILQSIGRKNPTSCYPGCCLLLL